MVESRVSSYRCKVEQPADFDEFWGDVLATAAEVPLEPEIEPVPLRSTAEVEVFAVHYRSLDALRIFGWYCRPRSEKCGPTNALPGTEGAPNAAPPLTKGGLEGVEVGQLPALLFVPGYISDPPLQKGWAKRGYAVLSVAPRGKLRSNQQFNPGYPGLLVHNIVDRNTYGYRGFYVDALRGVDFLRSRPEVDAGRIGVLGSSQGGGLSIVAAALRDDIAAASAGAPYLCGFMDAIELTDGYPYEEINDYLRLYPERREAVQQTLAYYDGISFAPRITCPIIVNIGLQDNVCPPETGYALFEAIASNDKKLYEYDQCGHDAGKKGHDKVIAEFMEKHLKGNN